MGRARSRNGPRLGKCRNQSRYRSPASTACGARRAPPGLQGCPRPMLLPLRLRQGLRRGRGAALGRPSAPNNRRDGPSRPERRAEQNAALSDNSQTSSQTRGPPHVRARGPALAAPRDDATTERPAGTPPVHDPPEDTEGFKLESRVKTDRAGSRASPAPGLRRSHVGPRRAAE